MFCSLQSTPPNPTIATLQIERRTAEADPPKPSVFRSNEIAQLSANQPTIAQGMLSDHELISELQILLIGHLDQPQSLDILELFGNPDRCLDRVV